MRLVDADVFEKRLMDAREYYIGEKADDFDLRFAAGLMSAAERLVDAPTVEAIPKDNVYKAIQEMMKYEHEGFINISLARLDEILKKCEVSE